MSKNVEFALLVIGFAGIFVLLVNVSNCNRHKNVELKPLTKAPIGFDIVSITKTCPKCEQEAELHCVTRLLGGTGQRFSIGQVIDLKVIDLGAYARLSECFTTCLGCGEYFIADIIVRENKIIDVVNFHCDEYY